MQNNDRGKYVVSVMVRSRLGTALYTVEKKPPNCEIILRNNAHRICLLQILIRKSAATINGAPDVGGGPGGLRSGGGPEQRVFKLYFRKTGEHHLHS